MTAQRTRLLVVGAGPSGLGMINTLVREGAIKTDDVLVVDPRRLPLGQFAQHVGNIGMRDMRSPWTVSVDRNNDGLYNFAEKRGCEPECFTRPSFDVFQMHAEHVWSGLNPAFLEDRVLGIAPGNRGKGWQVQIGAGMIDADNVVIATGLSAHRVAPLDNTIPIPDKTILQTGGRVAIIGGGMTATNAAFALIDAGHEVTLFAPRGLITDRNEDNAWFSGVMGDGTCISHSAEDARRDFIHYDTRHRYDTLTRGRIDGTVTSDHRAAFMGAVDQGAAFLERKRVVAVNSQDGRYTVVTEDASYPDFTAVYDARGFRPNLDNLRSITGLVEAVGNQRHEQYPLVDDRTGAVRKGLYFAGALSAMSFGPAADTVAGGTMLGHVMAQSHTSLRP